MAERAAARTAARNVITALVATVVTSGAIELYYRATYHEGWLIEPEFRPGRFPHLNSDGLRDLDYGPKQPGSYRILLLGDSFTFGSGVEDDGAIWPAIIERRLGELRPVPGVATYEVLNGGIAGSLTDKWVALYRQQRELFQPDLVLAVFFLRDGTRLDQVSEPLAAANLERIRSDPLAQVSTTYRYFREKWLARNFAGLFERFFTDSYVGDAEATAEWRRAQANLLEVRNLAKGGGARFGMATFPMLYGFEQDPYPFQPAMDAIERFCRANGIATLSLLPAFRGRRASDLWVSEINKHPNAEGHALTATALLPFVLQLIAAPSAR